MAGTGIKDVVARSGAPIGSLYHYFPGGKTQLVSESVQINADKSRRLLSKFFDGKQTGAAALRSLFHTAADGFERAGGNKGCAVGAVTLDLMPDDAALREICKSTFDDWVAIVAPCVPFADARAQLKRHHGRCFKMGWKKKANFRLEQRRRPQVPRGSAAIVFRIVDTSWFGNRGRSWGIFRRWRMRRAGRFICCSHRRIR